MLPANVVERQLIAPAEFRDVSPLGFAELDQRWRVVLAQKKIRFDEPEILRKFLEPVFVDEQVDAPSRVESAPGDLLGFPVDAPRLRVRLHAHEAARSDKIADERVEIHPFLELHRRIDPDRHLVAGKVAVGKYLDALGGLRLVVSLDRILR